MNNIMSAPATIEDQRSKATFKFIEAILPGVEISMDLKAIMSSEQSEFQKIEVIRSVFGKMLVTDGKTQSSEMDEYVYHESLIHAPLLKVAHNGNGSGPKTVFIGGGGELASAREVLRHKSVERVVMVDLDAKVVEVCRKYLPEWGGDKVAENPRLELIIGDAYEYLINCTEKFDAIIMDISDPIEAGPGIMLYTQEFYQHAKSLLNPNGVFVTQAGMADGITILDGIVPGSDEDFSSYAAIKNTLETVFECTIPYSVNIPSFGSDWGFVMAFDTCKESNLAMLEYTDVKMQEIDDMVDTHITEIDDIDSNSGDCKKGGDVLRFYDGMSHRRMFTLTKPLRVNMKMDTRVMTKDNPVFMY
jgi:spermidine synthase